MSILPPLITVIFALLLREVFTALFLGILSGGLIVGYYTDGFAGMLSGLLRPVDHFVETLSPASGDSGHISVILFSLWIGGMVAVISANGSMRALVNRISKRATTKRSGQFVTWLMGVMIFFDDFANTMVVGNTMRPLTDRLRISREKLAYIVDSTAAPIAAIALITTWIGAELQFIDQGIADLEHFPANKSAYSVFLNSLAYMFYPILTLLFILLLIWTGKDFGPMRKAEMNPSFPTSDSRDEVSNEGKIYKGLLPILLMIFATLFGLLLTGYDPVVWNDGNLGLGQKISLIIGAADSYKALLWASFGGMSLAIILSLPQMGLEKSMSSAVAGFKKMLPAVVILVLAWSLAGVTEEMHTADFISSALSGSLPPELFPATTFVLAAVIAFSTGTSWGTMAILYPVVIGASWSLGLSADVGLEHNYELLVNVISCVLAGSVLGDHCSPISDTTVLSSLATECDHLAHVKTQLPYALTVGLVSLLFGTLLTAYGLHSGIAFVLAAFCLYFIVSYFGKTSQ